MAAVADYPRISARYLITAADQTWILIHRRRPPASSDLAEAANLCCAALRTLSRDEDFRADVERLAQTWSTDRAEMRPVLERSTQQLGTFLDQFERQLLISIGLNVTYTDELIEQARSAASQVRRMLRVRRAVGWDELSNSLSALSTEACQLADALAEDGGHVDPQGLLPRFERVAKGAGGAVIIAINTSDWVKTLGVPPEAQVLSASFGWRLVEEAVSEIRRSQG